MEENQSVINQLEKAGYNVLAFGSPEMGDQAIQEWLDSPSSKIEGTFLHLDSIVIVSGSYKEEILFKILHYNTLPGFENNFKKMIVFCGNPVYHMEFKQMYPDLVYQVTNDIRDIVPLCGAIVTELQPKRDAINSPGKKGSKWASREESKGQ